MFRKRPQLIALNHLCALTSLAPDCEPSRRFSSLHSSLRMADLQLLLGQWKNFLTISNCSEAKEKSEQKGRTRRPPGAPGK